MIIVNPAAEDVVAAGQIAPRLQSLQGMTVGVVDNSKHMADVILRALEQELQGRYGVASFVRFRKPNASVPTPASKLAELALNCDAVIHGVAD